MMAHSSETKLEQCAPAESEMVWEVRQREQERDLGTTTAKRTKDRAISPGRDGRWGQRRKMR